MDWNKFLKDYKSWMKSSGIVPQCLPFSPPNISEEKDPTRLARTHNQQGSEKPRGELPPGHPEQKPVLKMRLISCPAPHRWERPSPHPPATTNPGSPPLELPPLWSLFQLTILLFNPIWTALSSVPRQQGSGHCDLLWAKSLGTPLPSGSRLRNRAE